MAQNVTPQRFGKTIRLEKIKELLPQGLSHEAIAEACGVSRRTIERDIKQWVDEGGFEEWLRQEFFTLHNKVRGNNEDLAYKTISGLLEKTMKQKIEANLEGSIIVKAWDVGSDKAKTARNSGEVSAASEPSPVSP